DLLRDLHVRRIVPFQLPVQPLTPSLSVLVHRTAEHPAFRPDSRQVYQSSDAHGRSTIAYGDAITRSRNSASSGEGSTPCSLALRRRRCSACTSFGSNVSGCCCCSLIMNST